jgi:hypothetical protein
MPKRFLGREARRLLTGVTTEFRVEMQRLLGGTALGPHLIPLSRSVPDRKRLSVLLRYGMYRLPDNEKRPDDALAAFFLVISELRVSSRPVRIFATKCMEYCESEALDGWSDSLADLKRAFAVLPRTRSSKTSTATAMTPTFPGCSRRLA